MNTDRSDQEGAHWLGLYVDLEDSKQVCFYDSFGRPTPKPVLEVLKKFVNKMNLPYMIKYKSNRIVQQALSSNRCGLHVARFLIGMFKTGNFEQSTDFDVKHGEGEAKKDEKKWRDFGYI